MLEALREEVFEANRELVRRGLVIYTFGNASGIARQEGLVVIKPSGVPYETLRPADLVVTDLDGHVVEGALRPSSDLPTHLVLYREFRAIGGVAHTHSRCATAWAQACREIPCFGTTHADYFHGPVPVTRGIEPQELEAGYEESTGQLIVERFRGLDALDVPAVLVACHGPFTWGASAAQAAHNAAVLEEIAAMAFQTVTLDQAARPISSALLEKHFRRKHGPGAYYGQRRD
ncbi:MAG: L-ribulose-5-phosphate 4-epimerase AraD [Bryobacteraceae bacterium]|jgi:L-ribulose-5-phosphate 4-epimerase